LPLCVYLLSINLSLSVYLTTYLPIYLSISVDHTTHVQICVQPACSTAIPTTVCLFFLWHVLFLFQSIFVYYSSLANSSAAVRQLICSLFYFFPGLPTCRSPCSSFLLPSPATHPYRNLKRVTKHTAQFYPYVR